MDAPKIATAVRGLVAEGLVARTPKLYSLVMGHAERPMILAALEYYGGNQSHVAKALGLNRNTLHKLIRKHGIQVARQPIPRRKCGASR